jgi:site-specific DNA recombinase
MFEDVEKKLFDAVIVHKLDRFSRSTFDTAIYKKKLKVNRIKFISVTENIDDSPEGRVMESVLIAFAEYYSSNLRREVLKGLNDNASKGKITGGLPPFGFNILEDKTLVINEDQATAVRKIFEMKAEGESLDAICHWINKHGYTTWTGKPMNRNTIRSILLNDKYKGDMVYNKTSRSVFREGGYFNNEKDIVVHKNVIPAIVPEKLFDEVQKTFKTQQNKNLTKAHEMYLLSGKIFCGHCEGSMAGNRRVSKKIYIHMDYQCLNKKRKRTCDKKSIKKEVVEELVLDHLEKYVFSDHAIHQLSIRLYEKYMSMINDSSDTVKALNKKLKEHSARIDNLIEAIMNGFNNLTVKERLDQMEKEKFELLAKIEEEKTHAKATMTIEEIKKYLSLGKGIRSRPTNEQRAIITQYVDKIFVYDDYIDIDLLLTDG